MPLYTTNDEFKFLQCGTCGVHHAIPLAMYDSKHSEGGFWHCPNGHQRGFGTGTVTAERDRLKQQLAQRDDEIAELSAARRKAEAGRTAAEKKLAASTKRAMAGVCPCCSRTFSN